MGKVKAHLEGCSKEERAKQRQNLGTLKQLAIQPQTHKRYQAARERFFAYLSENHLELPRCIPAFDDLLSDYVEHLWASGEGRALASDSVAAMQDAEPRLKGSLQGTWRLLKTWHTNEVPNRAPPLPEAVLEATLGWCLFHEDYAFGVSLLLGFYGLLRTGELLSVCNHHIFMTAPDKPAVVALGLVTVGPVLVWLWA